MDDLGKLPCAARWACGATMRKASDRDKSATPVLGMGSCLWVEYHRPCSGPIGSDGGSRRPLSASGHGNPPVPRGSPPDVYSQPVWRMTTSWRSRLPRMGPSMRQRPRELLDSLPIPGTRSVSWRNEWRCWPFTRMACSPPRKAGSIGFAIKQPCGWPSCRRRFASRDTIAVWRAAPASCWPPTRGSMN